MIDISELIEETINGQENPLRALAILKDLKRMIERGIKEISPIAIKEAEDEENKFSNFGYQFEKRSGTAHYSYDHLEDYRKAKNELKLIEEKYKMAYYNSVKKLRTVSDDGEIVELPKVTFGKDHFVIKPNK